MPFFIIERSYAEQIFPDAEGAAGINLVNDQEQVRWLFSFLSMDRRKSYCLYEAESPDAVRRAALRAGLPADVITEVAHRVLPEGTVVPVTG